MNRRAFLAALVAPAVVPKVAPALVPTTLGAADLATVPLSVPVPPTAEYWYDPSLWRDFTSPVVHIKQWELTDRSVLAPLEMRVRFDPARLPE